MLGRLLYLAGIVLTALLAYYLIEYVVYLDNREELVQQKAKETTESLRDEVDSILGAIKIEGERLADILGKEEFSEDEIEAMAEASSKSITEIQGVTISYEPYAFSEDKELYSPYYDKTSGLAQIGESYDYSDETAEGTGWYTEVRDGGARWVEPYYARAAKGWFVDYGIPFHYTSGPKEGEVRGTVTMSFIVSDFKDIIHSMSLGKTGYGIITSPKGAFLAHPVNEFVGTTRISEVRDSSLYSGLGEVFDALENGEVGAKMAFDPKGQRETLVYIDRIKTADWRIGLFFYPDDLIDDSNSRRRKKIRMAIALSLLIISLLAIFYNKDHLDAREIRILSLLTTLLFIADLLFIGYQQHTSDRIVSDSESQAITDVGALDDFVNRRRIRSESLKTPKERPIPTGLYLERMDFEDSYNLNIGGRIWQKYPLELVDSITLGFAMPQMSPFAEAELIEEVQRDTVIGKEGIAPYLRIVYQFRATVRLNFDYSDFPLDKRLVDLELVPLDRNDRLIFVPDLASYDFTSPGSRPGFSPSIDLSGSEVIETYYNFSVETYGSDFGSGDRSLYAEAPVLHYNLDLRRNMLNALVTYLIPIVVVLLMMFILISACGKTDERQGIIESMAAFFFVLIFSHIDLRKEIETAELMYIEYFYFVTYFMIVLSTFNLITYAKDKSAIFDYEENLLFKSSYFPVYMLAILILTLFKFY